MTSHFVSPNQGLGTLPAVANGPASTHLQRDTLVEQLMTQVNQLQSQLAAFMSERGATKLLKLLSDHNVIRTGMQNRMDNEHEWIGMIPEFRVANLNRRCYDPEVVQAANGVWDRLV
jgi:hypothetical protein